MRARQALPRLALALVALLPLYRLSHQSFWFDELFTVWVARRPWGDIPGHAAQDGFTPPLYYLLVAALWRAGLRDETLRILSAAFGALCLGGLYRLAGRLAGDRGRAAVLAFAGLSPFLLSLSQELRPYTAYLAASVWAVERFLAWRERPSTPNMLAWCGLVLLASALSYLGLALLPLALLAATRGPSPRYKALAAVAGVCALALLISLPGLTKASGLASERLARGRVRFDRGEQVPLARVLLGPGVRHEPLADAGDLRLAAAAEWSGRGILLLGAWLFWRKRDSAVLVALSASLLAVSAVFIADAVIGIGVTTRYLSLAFLPLAVLASLLALHVPRASVLVLLLVSACNAVGLVNYVFDVNYAREDWRGLMARLRSLRRPGDTALGMPGHHAIVAAAQYAPGLPLVGGFVGQPGEPVYLFRENAGFNGYDFEGRLERIDPEIANGLRARALDTRKRDLDRRLLLVTYADDDWHGDTRPIVAALGREQLALTERFPGREVLVLRSFEASSLRVLLLEEPRAK